MSMARAFIISGETRTYAVRGRIRIVTDADVRAAEAPSRVSMPPSDGPAASRSCAATRHSVREG